MTQDTHSEAGRHECEVRMVCTLTKARRDAYLYGDPHAEDRMSRKSMADMRGQAAADRLITDARAMYLQLQRARRDPPSPSAPVVGVAVGAPSTRSAQVNGADDQEYPGCGSSLATSHEGDSSPVETVVSGGGA